MTLDSFIALSVWVKSNDIRVYSYNLPVDEWLNSDCQQGDERIPFSVRLGSGMLLLVPRT